MFVYIIFLSGNYQPHRKLAHVVDRNSGFGCLINDQPQSPFNHKFVIFIAVNAVFRFFTVFVTTAKED